MIRAFSALILVGVLCFARISVAGQSAFAATDGQVVDVVVSGNPSATAGVEVVVRELLARLPVVLQWSQAPAIDPSQVLAQRAPDAHVVARAWMDLSSPTRARIYVANELSGRFVVRVVPLRDGYDEIAREVLGHIVESAVDAFLEGREVGVPREIAEREVTDESAAVPMPVPPPAPPAPRASFSEVTRIGVGLWYQVTEMAASKVMHGPAVGIGLAFPTGRAARFSASAALHYRLPLHWDSPSVGVRFDGAAARLGAGIEGDITRRVVLRGQLGLGVDFVHLDPYVEDGSAAKAGSPFWVLSPITTATLSLEAQLSRRIGLILGAGCDIDLSAPSYFVASDTGPTTVLAPW
ncbi:MAG TPA: hypothetical protein VGY54_08025, partial [Polyangiaceae bacterium]|nr:hypothetical protein [Polyangiaceae bacterium]